MDGRTTAEYTFTKKIQVVTLGMKSSVKIDGEDIQIDPQFLFKRLITVVQSPEELESAFKYELCSYPAALFDSSLLLRDADKPTLADAISNLCEPDVQADNFIISCNDIQYVLDGRALLQHIPWSRGSTCQDILNQYTEYAARKYGNAIVVFDG